MLPNFQYSSQIANQSFLCLVICVILLPLHQKKLSILLLPSPSFQYSPQIVDQSFVCPEIFVTLFLNATLLPPLKLTPLLLLISSFQYSPQIAYRSSVCLVIFATLFLEKTPLVLDFSEIEVSYLSLNAKHLNLGLNLLHLLSCPVLPDDVFRLGLVISLSLSVSSSFPLQIWQVSALLLVLPVHVLVLHVLLARP